MRHTLSNHAQKVLLERNIARDWVERTLVEPERREPDPSDPALERFYRRIPERDDRVLRVIVNTSVDPPRVVSVFFDRAMKGRI